MFIDPQKYYQLSQQSNIIANPLFQFFTCLKFSKLHNYLQFDGNQRIK